MSKQDSLQLNQVWQKLFKAVQNQDINAVKALCLPKIFCVVCYPDVVKDPEDYFISARTFTNQYLAKVFHEKVRSVIQSEAYNLWIHPVPDYLPSHLKLEKGQKLLLYELAVQTWKAGEYAPGHEGGTDLFQFVKVNEELKFYGHTTIP
ncbi:hypothetical protein GXP67_22600 [Rhodocytophaga rosea]|uniref:Uncharacterized protein n=1 Tax=Rhodocytophaga rosea TaxID=2704465 RepID=A0A6C0GMH6_9BACT|nr:hypothetical protein [Rhodocytophaga rosea]QHT69225.1 hypothetical protein GXP67_22600 [Rhodocytophaga rosea]